MLVKQKSSITGQSSKEDYYNPLTTHLRLTDQNSRIFYKCPQCSLIFAEHTLDREGQEKHYKGQWKNYDREHITVLTDNLLKIINKHRKPSRILDFRIRIWQADR